MIKVELQEWMGSDRSIAEAAWTSSTTLQGKDKRTEEDVERVVKMLITSKHASPIESVVMRFWIKMPIATDRQHMTHRVASHNGMSGRYRTMPNEFYDLPKDISVILDRFPSETKRYFENNYHIACTESNNAYQNIIRNIKDMEKDNDLSKDEYKRLREFFRGMLPQHNMTERITIMNLRSFANYQKLRNNNHAQPEIRLVAEQMLAQVKEKNVCPIALSTLEEMNWDI